MARPEKARIRRCDRQMGHMSSGPCPRPRSDGLTTRRLDDRPVARARRRRRVTAILISHYGVVTPLVVVVRLCAMFTTGVRLGLVSGEAARTGEGHALDERRKVCEHLIDRLATHTVEIPSSFTYRRRRPNDSIDIPLSLATGVWRDRVLVS